MKEIWKDIKGYEGLYQISNYGRVKSFYNNKEKILKSGENSKGYLRAELKKDKKTTRFFIHRLVAEHFLNKEEGKNIVNHLDCNPKNNRLDNLEWTTPKGNSEYMKKLKRNKRTEEWLQKLSNTQRKVKGKRVQATSITNNKKILNYETVNGTKRDGFQPSCVSCCCNHKRLSHKGYTWRFVN